MPFNDRDSQPRFLRRPPRYVQASLRRARSRLHAPLSPRLSPACAMRSTPCSKRAPILPSLRIRPSSRAACVSRSRKRLRTPRCSTPAQREGSSENYRRHLLAADPHGRYAIAALVWQPHQASPVHAHHTWCGYAVIDGALSETVFEWNEREQCASAERTPGAQARRGVVRARRPRRLFIGCKIAAMRLADVAAYLRRVWRAHRHHVNDRECAPRPCLSDSGTASTRKARTHAQNFAPSALAE